jgi:hypothetical protein
MHADLAQRGLHLTCPPPMPPPTAICTMADMAALWLTGKRSPRSEKTRGKQPPTEMPVNIRTRKNCHSSVTCRTAQHSTAGHSRAGRGVPVNIRTRKNCHSWVICETGNSTAGHSRAGQGVPVNIRTRKNCHSSVTSKAAQHSRAQHSKAQHGAPGGSRAPEQSSCA